MARSIHGLSDTPIGRTWCNMRARCLNSNVIPFKKYGARGIWICKFLAESPKNIIAMIGNRPSGKSIDRISGKGGYTCGECNDCIAHDWPLNIRWLTTKEQNRNTARNLMVTINGKTRCVSDWAERSGIFPTTLYYRVKIGLRGNEILSPLKRRGTIPISIHK